MEKSTIKTNQHKTIPQFIVNFLNFIKLITFSIHLTFLCSCINMNNIISKNQLPLKKIEVKNFRMDTHIYPSRTTIDFSKIGKLLE